MLFYNLISDNEGKDNSEGNDAYYDKELLSKQCITCVDIFTTCQKITKIKIIFAMVVFTA